MTIGYDDTMWRQLLSRVLGHPPVLADEPDAAPLEGLAGEATLLLAAYESIAASSSAPLPTMKEDEEDEYVPSPVAEMEAELDAQERGRWMRDANEWAVRARRAAKRQDNPYRGASGLDVRLHEAGTRVKEAAAGDLAEAVAEALTMYVEASRRAR